MKYLDKSVTFCNTEEKWFTLCSKVAQIQGYTFVEFQIDNS